MNYIVGFTFRRASVLSLLKEKKRRRDFCLRLESIYQQGDFKSFLKEFNLDSLPEEAIVASSTQLLHSKALYSETLYNECIVSCHRLLGTAVFIVYCT